MNVYLNRNKNNSKTVHIYTNVSVYNINIQIFTIYNLNFVFISMNYTKSNLYINLMLAFVCLGFAVS